MPTAGPPTAATIGLLTFGKTLKSCQVGEPSPPNGPLRKSLTSFPAVKQSAEPESRTARTPASASAAASACASCVYISRVMAFFLSRRSKRMRATRSRASLLIKAEVLELLPQLQLGELAGRGMRQLGDEHHVVGHPPLGDLAFVEAQQIRLRDVLPGLLHRDDDRALVPLGMAHADDSGFGDRRGRDRDVLDVAVRFDGAHVADRAPSVLERISAFALEIALDNPPPAHLQIAERLAV